MRMFCIIALIAGIAGSAIAGPVTVNAVCVPANGWMSDGWGTCKFIIKNTGTAPAKLVKWTARWDVAGKTIGDPWGDKLDVEIAPGKDITRSEQSYLPPEAVEKSKPGNATIVGTFTVSIDGVDSEVPYSLAVPVATLPEKLKTVKGKHIGISLMESRFKKFPGQENILRWMDQSCGAMKDLTGYKPFDGKMQIIQECPPHPWWAYAGNPVVCNTDYVGTTIEEINDGYIPFGWVHEVGHNFDVLGDWYIWNGPAAEWQANWKLVYAFETIADRSFKVRWGRNPSAAYQPAGSVLITDGYHFVDAFFTFFGDSYLADPSRKWDTMSSDEMHSFFQRIQRVYGWDPYKKWYRAYSRFEALGYKKPETPEAKVQLIAAILSQETGADLLPAFQRWRWPVTEQDVEAMMKAYPVNYRQQIKGDVSTKPIPGITGVSPIFKGWATSSKPISCEFKGKPETEYQVFVGLIEHELDKPATRLVDIEIASKTVGTVDTFNGHKDTPHGYIYKGTTDKQGILRVAVKPSAQSVKKDAAVCGFMLFPADAKLDVKKVINGTDVDPLLIVDAMGYDPGDLGNYFTKTEYKKESLPVWNEVKGNLPSPIYDENPDLVDYYWKAWEVAVASEKQPGNGSCLISNYLTQNTGGILTMSDSAMMAMLCNYGHKYVPGIQSLDNFYRVQLKSGGIVTSIGESSGIPSPGTSFGTPESINEPIAAWAERESYRMTGDRKRLRSVYETLGKYYQACQKLKDPTSGLFGSDLSANAGMALFARDMAYIARELGKQPDADRYDADASSILSKINTNGLAANENMVALGCYALADGSGSELAANLASKADVQVLSSDAVTSLVCGMDRYGSCDAARELAIRYLEQNTDELARTGRFVGAGTPVTLMIEQIVGIHADAPSNTIVWNIKSPKRVGVERFWFGGRTVSLICEESDASGKRKIRIDSDGPVKLQVNCAGKSASFDITTAGVTESSI